MRLCTTGTATAVVRAAVLCRRGVLRGRGRPATRPGRPAWPCAGNWGPGPGPCDPCRSPSSGTAPPESRAPQHGTADRPRSSRIRQWPRSRFPLRQQRVETLVEGDKLVPRAEHLAGACALMSTAGSAARRRRPRGEGYCCHAAKRELLGQGAAALATPPADAPRSAGQPLRRSRHPPSEQERDLRRPR
jgi:hypothetical protein